MSSIVRIKCIGKIDSKLQFVKTMKTHSGLGLKESKDLCESIMENKGQDFIVNVITSPMEFENEISQMLGPNIQVSNREVERQIKLVSLGLGDDNDKIELILDDLSAKLLTKVRINNDRDLYPIFKNFLFDIITEFNSQQLEEIFNKNIVKQEI